jgi:hypothetical protein
VLERVAHEVRDDPFQAPRVSLEHDRVGFDLDTIVPASRAHGCGDERADVDGLLVDACLPRVEPGDLHQVLDEVSEPRDVVDEELSGAPGLLRHAVEVLGEERGLRDESGQRRAQLVRDI